MITKDKSYVKSKYRNGQPVYAVTLKEASSSGGMCMLKYGWSASLNPQTFKMTILVYHKIACTDDGVKYVSRKKLLRAWNDIPGYPAGGVCNWCLCIGSYTVAACTSLAGETWPVANPGRHAPKPRGLLALF